MKAATLTTECGRIVPVLLLAAFALQWGLFFMLCADDDLGGKPVVDVKLVLERHGIHVVEI